MYRLRVSGATIKTIRSRKNLHRYNSERLVESRINPEENVDDEAYEKLAYDLISW